MITSDPTTQRAVEAFRSLLESDPRGTRQELVQVRQGLAEQGLIYGDSPVPLCFAPALIGESRLRPIRADMHRLVRVLTRLERALIQGPWLDRLGISAEEQELIRIPSRLPPGGYISRIDGFLGPSEGNDTGYRIVELNVDSPGGGAFMDACARLVMRCPTWKEFMRRYPGRYLPTDTRDLPLLLKAWKAWGGHGSPRVAIVDWVTVNTASEFDVLKRRYRSKGVDTVVADPRELEFKGGRLLDYEGKPIDVVYRRVLVEDILAQGEAARPLLAACRAGAVCVVNTLSSKPLTVKSLLALLHTSDAEQLLNASDLAFMRSLIPWTAVVEDGPVLKTIRARRDQLILKPADGYGGQGLFLGWELDAGQWEKGIEEAVNGRYVAQERVFIPCADFPIPHNGGWQYGSFRVDFDPYMFGQGMADPLVRISEGDVLNVKAGAQIAVTWVMRD